MAGGCRTGRSLASTGEGKDGGRGGGGRGWHWPPAPTTIDKAAAAATAITAAATALIITAARPLRQAKIRVNEESKERKERGDRRVGVIYNIKYIYVFPEILPLLPSLPSVCLSVSPSPSFSLSLAKLPQGSGPSRGRPSQCGSCRHGPPGGASSVGGTLADSPSSRAKDRSTRRALDWLPLVPLDKEPARSQKGRVSHCTGRVAGRLAGLIGPIQTFGCAITEDDAGMKDWEENSRWELHRRWS